MRLDVGPKWLEDAPACGLSHVSRFAEVAIELIEAIKLGLVGSVHRRSGRVIEAALVLVSQRIEIRCRHESIVDGMKGLSWGIGRTRNAERSPMSRLTARGNGTHVVCVDRVSGRLNSFPQAAGDPLFHHQKRHHFGKMVDLQVCQMIFDLENGRCFR